MCAPLGRLQTFEKSRHPRAKILSMQGDLCHNLNRYEHEGAAAKGLTYAYASRLEVLNLLLASDSVTEYENAIIE